MWLNRGKEGAMRRLLLDLSRRFTIDLYVDPAGRTWTAVIPELPGCITEGSTAQEARTLIIEAASQYMDQLADLEVGLPAPGSRPVNPPVQHTVTVDLWEIVETMELDPENYLGTHVTLTTMPERSVVVFPVNKPKLSATTVALLVHYTGMDATQFLQMIEDAVDECAGEDRDGEPSMFREPEPEGRMLEESGDIEEVGEDWEDGTFEA